MIMEKLILALSLVVVATIQLADAAYYNSVTTALAGTPKSIAVDSDNTVWICSNVARKVHKWTNEMVAVSSINTYCNSILIDGVKLWVAGANGGGANVYNKDTAAQLKVVYPGSSYAVKKARNGEIWVTSIFVGRMVTAYDPTTYALIAETPSGTTCTGTDIGFDSKNNGWLICEDYNGKMYKITPGTMALSAPFGTANLVTAMGIAVDTQDNLWVSSNGSRKIVLFDSNGSFKEDLRLSIDPQGMFYNSLTNKILAACNGAILEFSPSTPITIGEQYPAGTNAREIAIDSFGNLWSANNGNSVTKLSVPTQSPTTLNPTQSPTLSPTTPAPTQPTRSPSASPTISHCNVLDINACNDDSECIWFPINSKVSACRARALVIVDCSQYLTTTTCKAPGRPLTYCIWNTSTQKCANRFTPNPTSDTAIPTASPVLKPTTAAPTKKPSKKPSSNPTKKPSRSPTRNPTTKSPTKFPTTGTPTTKSPTASNTKSPSASPTSPCDFIKVQATCTANTLCKWTLVKANTYACRSTNWGSSSATCAAFTTLAQCQALIDGVSFCVWDKPNKTCKARFA